MSAHKVVVVGSANADLVLANDHRPAAGATILGSDVVTNPGGKGANQAVAAGRLGFDLQGIRVVDAPTGNAIILVTPDGETSIIVSPAADRYLTPALVDELKPV